MKPTILLWNIFLPKKYLDTKCFLIKLKILLIFIKSKINELTKNNLWNSGRNVRSYFDSIFKIYFMLCMFSKVWPLTCIIQHKRGSRVTAHQYGGERTLLYREMIEWFNTPSMILPCS